MLRRLYMLFPNREVAEQAVYELKEMGIEERNLHTIAHPNINIKGLPKANTRQKNDFAAKLEEQLWGLNLLLFSIAFFVFAASLFTSNPIIGITSALVMLFTFLAGYYFASYVPHAHLNECRGAISHGDILLLVDIPRWKIQQINQAMHLKHPDMELGGVTWTLPGL